MILVDVSDFLFLLIEIISSFFWEILVCVHILSDVSSFAYSRRFYALAV